MPHVRTIAITIVAAGLFVVSGCSSSDTTSTTSTTVAGGATSTTSGGSETTVPATVAPSTTVPGSITDPAVPIEATVGEDFTITVESNPTTGYTWNVTGNPADSIAVPIGATPVTGASMPGEGGTETFRFKASGPGTTEITLTYARSFEPEDDPTVQEYTLVVTA